MINTIFLLVWFNLFVTWNRNTDWFWDQFRNVTTSLLPNSITTCVECIRDVNKLSQSALMSVSSGKVVALKSRFNLSSTFLFFSVFLSHFFFHLSEIILFLVIDVPSKFGGITFSQNTAWLIKKSLLRYFATSYIRM